VFSGLADRRGGALFQSILWKEVHRWKLLSLCSIQDFARLSRRTAGACAAATVGGGVSCMGGRRGVAGTLSRREVNEFGSLRLALPGCQRLRANPVHNGVMRTGSKTVRQSVS
jgi:hypothetical protein